MRQRSNSPSTRRTACAAWTAELERFLAGEVSTDLLPLVELAEPSPGLAPTAAALALAELTRERRTVQRGIPVAWRNVVSQPQVTEFEDGTRVEWWAGRETILRHAAADE